MKLEIFAYINRKKSYKSNAAIFLKEVGEVPL